MGTALNTPPDPGNFLFVGEHAALDFANTLMAANGAPFETLHDHEDVLRWLVLARLLKISEKRALLEGLKAPSKQLDLLNQIRAMRALWKANLERLLSGKSVSPELLSAINASLRKSLHWEVLRQASEARTFHLHSEHDLLDPVGEVTARVAHEIAHFLATAKLQYLRRCTGPDCVIVFYDTTKSHRRQWCSMAICGNRHKVAKFRAKAGKTAN